MTTSVVEMMGKMPRNIELKEQFLRWQCRVRQIAMRENQGRPDDAITPSLTLDGDAEPMGHIITVMSKRSAHSLTPEFRHMVKRTHDPAQRREKAIEYLSSSYFQHINEFSDSLTSTFPPGSPGAERIVDVGVCILVFEAFNQRYRLHCAVNRLREDRYLFQATFWHNMLFNPGLHPDTEVLEFIPDWDMSSTERMQT